MRDKEQTKLYMENIVEAALDVVILGCREQAQTLGVPEDEWLKLVSRKTNNLFKKVEKSRLVFLKREKENAQTKS